MTEPRPAVRVLLADDQELIRMGFRMVLEAEETIDVVGEAGDGGEAIAAALALRPDVVVMDVRMPSVDGIAATEAIVRRLPETRVLILTTYDIDEYAFAGLRAGASGFLLKNARPAELVAAIRTVAGGDAIVEPRITKRLLELFGPQLPRPGDDASSPSPGGASDPRLSSLTEREFEVFEAIARGLTNTEIATAFFLSESTVKTHVGHVLLKLGLRDRVHAVVLGYETGVVVPGGAGA
ncbi:response regulator transcription factor [Naasia aerilata]|uniref:DNA-binding response regulator n=1 Tax=Naasia aerilata TaxID=1162966 RepID=A0ABM8GD85_9MICO|nr:response regulator transcription factor [Naasia aerilata]BDZ46230.1 DNA-binding response regulator [Naasia aerilata]